MTLWYGFVSWLCINYVSVEVKNRFPLWKTCLVNHTAYTKFSDSESKKKMWLGVGDCSFSKPVYTVLSISL